MPDNLSSGVFSDGDVLAARARFRGAGDDHSEGPEVRFLRAVSRLVRNRLTELGVNTDTSAQPAVFLLHPAVPDSLTDRVVKHPMLDNGQSVLGGHMWFVSQAANVGNCYPYDPCTDVDLFSLVVDELKLGTVPAVVYDPRVAEPTVRFYRDGLGDPEACDVLPLNNPVVGVDEVFAVIARVHETVLVTPNAQGPKSKLWAKATAGWAVQDAELLIQMHLITALNSKFTDCTIRSEQHQVSGRLDIEIEGVLPSGGIQRHVVLELKVLRALGETGRSYSGRAIGKWIDEGVDQAYSYAAERLARESALCCFDMRPSFSDKGCYTPSIVKKASQLNVRLGSWFLFSTLKDYRASKVAKKLPARS